ncbi:hypothetical protein [Longimicrobium sp.]|uniref:hypothetical protein n=1 Tax=Longimicrobium sp. TaxID=2029185 RepID=UPI002E326344|nr:hypothetical protein [Longimicrobium sp.]HEX6041378.1 hypothetical protein [Longimicrobium sp.]
MTLLERIRLPRARPAAPAPAVAAVPVPALVGPELTDDDLEQVVGGLERVYVPGLVAAD